MGAANDTCHSLAIPNFTIPGVGIHCKVAFVDGLRTFEVTHMSAFPEGPLPQSGISMQGTGQRWGLRLSGKFVNLNVWVLATKDGRSYINGSVCCPQDFHWMIQLSAVCSEEERFHGNV